MNSLQLSLLIVGILVIGIIYVWFRLKMDKPFSIPFLKSKYSDDDIPELDDEIYLEPMPSGDPSAELDKETLSRLSGISVSRDEPVDLERLKGISVNSSVTTEPNTESNKEIAPADTKPAPGNELIIVLTVMAKQHANGNHWGGEQLIPVLNEAGLHSNEMKIFQYDTAGGQFLFGVASAVEPGFLDPAAPAQLVTPGLTLFLQLPAPLDAHQAFITMLEVAEKIASQLGGEVCDDKRNKLTAQSINQIKDQINVFSLKQNH